MGSLTSMTQHFYLFISENHIPNQGGLNEMERVKFKY